MKWLIDYLKDQIFRRENIVLLLLVGGFLIWYTSHQKELTKAVRENPVETEATILRVKGCFKNGKCIDFAYSFEGELYQGSASVTWKFANWCKARNDCRGMKFRMVLEDGNPENFLVYWEEMYSAERKRKNHRVDSLKQSAQ
jgi:hypothetical protein